MRRSFTTSASVRLHYLRGNSGFGIPAIRRLAVALVCLPLFALANRPAAEASLVKLGERLFFDTRLSADGKVSCASCHKPERAFTDGLVTGRGVSGIAGTRNTPSLVNVSLHGPLFWDGRRESLEQQALDPLTNPSEHGLSDHEAVLNLLRADREYREAFNSVLGVNSGDFRIEDAGRALAAFQKTLIAFDSPFDRYIEGDVSAMTPSQRRGYSLFSGRARCVGCHLIQQQKATFTDNGFHGIGIGNLRWQSRLARLSSEVMAAKPEELGAMVISRAEISSLGRFIATRNAKDIGKFKTPSLRNVELTAPYMHDGSVATLEVAVDQEIYYRSVTGGKPIVMTAQEKSDIVDFLRALTSECSIGKRMGAMRPVSSTSGSLETEK